MSTVLVTGGAGYIGSVLVRLLLDSGRSVRVLDSLRFGGESIVGLLNDPRVTFVHGDVRDPNARAEALSGADAVVHLAAIVGDPACAREPEETRTINLEASQALYEDADSAGLRRFVFASTCSNYGKSTDPTAYLTEDAELRPVSLYAQTKVEVERWLLGQDRARTCIPTSLRLSTVYGLSPRPRFDLTVNEFSRELALGRELVIFGEQFWRPYCHVVDLARGFLAVLDADTGTVGFDVFNVGSTDENYTKKMLADLLLEVFPEGHITYVHKDEDPRDYRVAFEKIAKRLGFEITYTVPQGIRQVAKALREGFFTDPDSARYRNVP